MPVSDPPPPSPLRDVLGRNGWRPRSLGSVPERLPAWELDTALKLALELADAPGAEDLGPWRQALYREGRRSLFPERFPEPAEDVRRVAAYFFPLADAVVAEDGQLGGAAVSRRLPFEPLEEEEIARWPSGSEYRSLLGHLAEDHVLACLAMSQQWLGYSLMDHILGVTGLAAWVGRQLARAVAVDLPLLHGAAIGHDIGKFGCIGDEERRIPRLHYYYTHVWYQARSLPGLGHIATNHSCWDLEAIRLPVETQLLIYADFRVKEAGGVGGRSGMSLISLKDAFATIRDKLENVDVAKLRRYRAVYRKLRDLEDYLLHLDVQLDPPGFDVGGPPPPDLPVGLGIVDVLSGRQRPDVVALATGRGIATVSRLFTTAHNIGVMERLRDAPALRALLEEARSYEGWRDLRTYIGILGQYSPALSMEQKELALDFFFDLLQHRDDDVRYHAANRIGDLLALGEDFWRKDLPEGVAPANGSWVLAQLERVLALLDQAPREAEEDMGPVERVVYALPVILRRLVRHAEPALREEALALILDRCSERTSDRRPLVGLYVCETFEVLLPHFSLEQKLELVEVSLAWAFHGVENTRLMAWRLLLGLARAAQREPELLPGIHYCVELLARRLSPSMLVAELYLLDELATLTGRRRVAERCREMRESGRFPVREVLLRNLKARVGWVEKKVNCDYLLASVMARVASGQDPEAHFAAEVAAHLANVLKVSRVEGARFHAGRCLLALNDVLTVPQRNDLAVELVRSLQLDAEAITRYIPRFLGAVVASLPEQEFLEALDDIELHVRRGAEPLQRLLLQSVGWVISSLTPDRLDGDALRRLAGMLLGALAETRETIVHEGFAQIGMVLDRLSGQTPGDGRLTGLLGMITKSVLSLVTHVPGEQGRFLLIASALNHLDRATARARPRVRFAQRPSVGFLPGTFDPFTSAHAEVVTRVLGHLDEVLVQVDDYSWRKHAQPRQIRRTLAWMALASIPEAFEAPFEPPVNLANPRSVRLLRRRLGHRDVWVVVGTDVLEGASAYRDPAGPIWDLPHLVVVRESHRSRAWEERLGWFRSGVQVVHLEPRARTVSSTSLRAALDRGGDLDGMCDPLVARTLQERRLYVRYPSLKDSVRAPRFALTVRRGLASLPRALHLDVRIESLPPAARWTGRRCETCTLATREHETVAAALSWREVAAAALPVELGDRELALLPEKRLVGLGALADVFASAPGGDDSFAYATLLSRVMARWLDAGLLFGLTALVEASAPQLWRLLQECGFSWLADRQDGDDSGRSRWAAVRLTEPTVLVWDLEQVLQPLYLADPGVVRVIAEGRGSLAAYFARRRPGDALLQVYERETKRMVVEWARERLASAPPSRQWVVLGLGPQFYRDLISDTPTLALDLERFLTWQGYEGGVHASVGSPELEMQLHTARELGRDAVLLVPFLEHEAPVLQVQAAARVAGVALREVLIGVTSSAAHAALHLQGIPHRCGSVVPRWHGVVRESALMPYLGGWSILGREPLEIGSLRPSLNDCLPYHHPHPMGLDGEAALDFSRLVLDHTRRLLETLEEAFRATEGRILSLRDLSAVVRTPRCPPLPRGFLPPRDSVPSELLEDDMEALARLHPERHETHRTRWRAP